MNESKAGLQTQQPMQMYWAPRRVVWAGCSFLSEAPQAPEFSL